MKLKELIKEFEILAPPFLAEEWDNVGLMAGDEEQNIKNVFVCLEVTSENVEQAIDFGADLMVSHHPLLFKPLKRVVESDINGGIVRALIKNDISVYSMHTNFDNADGGMNDLLAGKIGLVDVRRYTDDECIDEAGEKLDNIGRVGVLQGAVTMDEFVENVKDKLNCSSIKYVGGTEDTVKTVALCSGAGGEYLYSAYRAGADVYLTSDVRHHEAQLARELGMNLIDAGHFETENIICEFLHGFLLERYPELNVKISNSIPYFA